MCKVYSQSSTSCWNEILVVMLEVWNWRVAHSSWRSALWRVWIRKTLPAMQPWMTGHFGCWRFPSTVLSTMGSFSSPWQTARQTSSLFCSSSYSSAVLQISSHQDHRLSTCPVFLEELTLNEAGITIRLDKLENRLLNTIEGGCIRVLHSLLEILQQRSRYVELVFRSVAEVLLVNLMCALLDIFVLGTLAP